MRELKYVDYCNEVKENSKELSRIVKTALKKKDESVPDNFVKMAEKALDDKGIYEIGGLTLKYKTEKVLVIDTRDLDEVDQKTLNEFESFKKIDNHYEVTFIGELNKVISV